MPEAQQIGVTEQTYYRWGKQYSGMPVDPKRLKPLEKENARLTNPHKRVHLLS